MFDMPIFEPTEPFRESMYMTGYQASITVCLQQGEGRKPSQDTHLARARCQITAERHFGENHTRKALDHFQGFLFLSTFFYKIRCTQGCLCYTSVRTDDLKIQPFHLSVSLYPNLDVRKSSVFLNSDLKL